MSNPEGKLRVRFTSDLKEWHIVNVNADQPHPIQNKAFDGHLRVLIKNFHGHTASPSAAPIKSHVEYFSTKKRAFSFQIQGRFKQDVDGDDVWFRADFEKPLKPPIGTSIAVEFARLIDPGLTVNLKGNKPSIYSPVLCGMNTVNCKALTDNDLSGNDVREDVKQGVVSGFDLDIAENVKVKMPSGKRRKFFQNEGERKKFVFRDDKLYSFEFFSPYVDWNRFDLNMGISISTVKYLNQQPVRFFMVSKDSNQLYFALELDLI